MVYIFNIPVGKTVRVRWQKAKLMLGVLSLITGAERGNDMADADGEIGIK